LGTTIEDSRAKSPHKPDAATLKLVKAIQHALASLQYAPGPADGTLKAETVRAIREFEMDQGLSPTGRISGRFIGRLARAAGRNFELPVQ
jgi:peptidoglycan hydrolase-like protein with peptidoglycan-binding domain